MRRASRAAPLRRAKYYPNRSPAAKCHSKASQSAGVQSSARFRPVAGHAKMQTTADHYLQVNLAGAFSSADVPSARLRPGYLVPAQLEALMLE